ncbi:hypothetical protein [Streptomyces sp. NPDC056323]|uniref:hypothetical protein n=1 Tax=unclassified Streptomyces TaxID=2593676 RepID=UPI0035DEA54E
MLLSHLNVRLPTSNERAVELHLRYLDLLLLGIRNTPTTGDQSTRAPDWAELRSLWNSP